MPSLLTFIAPYRKFLAPIVALAVLVVGQVLGVDSKAYVDLTMVATALGVLGLPNTPATPPAAK